VGLLAEPAMTVVPKYQNSCWSVNKLDITSMKAVGVLWLSAVTQ
jgi:hypothetical protein